MVHRQAPRDEVTRALRTALRLSGHTASRFALAFVASLLVARSLGPELRGVIAIPVVVLTLAFSLSHAGVEHAQVHAASSGIALQRLWGDSTVLAVVLSLPVWLAAALLALAAGGSPFEQVPLWWLAVAIAQLPLMIHTLYWVNLLNLDDRLVTTTRVATGAQAVHTVAVAVLFGAGWITAFRALSLMWAANVLTWALLLRTGTKAGLTTARSSRESALGLLRAGLKAHVGLVAIFLMLRLDQFFVQALAGFEELGRYAVAASLSDLLPAAALPMAIAILPHQVAATGVRAREQGLDMARLSFVLASTGAIVAFFLAPWAIPAIYGEAFRGATPAFQVLLPGAVAFTVLRPVAAVFLKEGRFASLSAFALSALTVNVAGNMLLIPRWGIAGAAASTSASYAALTAAVTWSTMRGVPDAWQRLRPRIGDATDLRAAFTADKSARTLDAEPRGERRGSVRVLFVVFALARGGAERVMVRLANAWVERSDVAIASLSRSADRYTLDPRVARFVVRPERSRLPSLLRGLRKLAGLRRLVKDYEPDVIVSFIDTTNIATIVSTRFTRTPVIVSERVDVSAHVVKRRVSLARRITYPRADALVVQTDRIAETVRARRLSRRVVVIPNPVVPASVRAGERDASLIVAMGRLEHQKGFDVLLRAFANVRREYPGARLEVLGDGPLRDDLLGLGRELGLGDSVVLRGSVEDPEMHLSRAAVFALSSRYEGFPNALVEAMSLGTAVVAADCPTGPREIIEDGRDGLLVPPEDPDALSGAISRLLGAPELRERLGAEAAGVVERFSIDAVSDRWFALFDSVGRGRRAHLRGRIR